jgi:hypothetical protein
MLEALEAGERTSLQGPVSEVLDLAGLLQTMSRYALLERRGSLYNAHVMCSIQRPGLYDHNDHYNCDACDSSPKL